MANADCVEIEKLEKQAASQDRLEAATAKAQLSGLIDQIKASSDRSRALHADCPEYANGYDIPGGTGPSP